MKDKARARRTVSASSVLLSALLVATACLWAAVFAGAQNSNSRKRPTQQVALATVRGRIDKKGNVRTYPAAYVKVTLTPRAYKDDMEHTMLVYTGPDGMYYFNVPPGSYILRIWLNDKQSKDYLIEVRNQKYVDVAPIVIS
jgi:hypothetical protein